MAASCRRLGTTGGHDVHSGGGAKGYGVPREIDRGKKEAAKKKIGPQF
jgi:hypothetical protein